MKWLIGAAVLVVLALTLTYGLTGGGSRVEIVGGVSTVRTDGIPGVVSSSHPKTRTGRVNFRLYCSGERVCAGKVKFTSGGELRGTRRFAIEPQEHVRLRFRVPKNGPRRESARLDFFDSEVVLPWYTDVTVIRVKTPRRSQ